jgi:alkylation response protein AidB-like acyl-CoA dehydrogenase
LNAEDVLEQVRDLAPFLREHASEAEALGRLPEETTKRLKETGVVRLLQPRNFGGFEADPGLFFDAVMAIGSCCGASGWVSGIVGVHPWELGLLSEEAQSDVWAADVDTWVCSSYMPGGIARRTDGGYLLSGEWSFSSGCDTAEWAFLGGILVDDDGKPSTPPDVLHFLVARSDFGIVDDSWDVVGLCGTGSKNVVVDGAFVPSHRTIRAAEINAGTAPGLAVNDAPVLRMPWSCVFPGAITAALIGIAEGAMREAISYQQDRVSVRQGQISDSPVVMTSIGNASSEIAASRGQFRSNVDRMYALVQRGLSVPVEMRSDGRRDQVRASWRSVRAVDDLFDQCGGGSLRRGTALQRLWRDAHAGLHHVINTTDKTFQSWARVSMGFEPVDWMV